MWFERDGVEIDAANQIAHLITAPLVPERIILRRRRRAGGDPVTSLESCNVGIVITDICPCGWRLSGDRNLRISNTIQMQAVQVVIANEVHQHIYSEGCCIRMTRFHPEFRADAMSLKTYAAGAIRQKCASQPVVGSGDNLPRYRIITAMQVKDMIRIGRRTQCGSWSEVRIFIPDRADDDECMHFDPVGVRFIDQIL